MSCRRRRRGRFAWSVVIACGVAAPGCQDEGGATVRGKITYQGQPVANGSVAFIAKGTPGAYSRLEPDGSFELLNHEQDDRIEPGAYAAVITINRSLVGPEAQQELPIPVIVTNQATTPLRYEVKEGENVIDIDLDKLPPGN